MPMPVKDIAASLLRKGFQSTGGDHVFYHLWVNGKKTAIFTKVSHGEKEVSDGLIGKMARQTRLSRKDFCRLVECSLSGDDYTSMLRSEDHIS